MKLRLMTPLLLLTLMGCDAPQRGRAPNTFVNGTTLQNFGGVGGPGFTSTTGGTIVPTIDTGTTGVTSRPGFQNCDLGDRFSTVDIGSFGICQSTVEETSFLFRTTNAQTSVRTCLIPTYKDSAGSSTYIGNPQCALTSANQIVSGRLYKDRQGFTGYPLNGVIVMKEPLLPEYIGCMQGYTNWPVNLCPSGPTNGYCATWISRCPGGARTNPYCDVEAKSYMRTICENFKTKYPNGYVDIRTR